MERVPPAVLRELNGGVLVVEDEVEAGDDLPDLYTLGEYVEDEGGLGRYIVLYYGSFRAVLDGADAEEWEAELWETIRHELRHHLESLAGLSDLDAEDAAFLAEYRRWLAEEEGA
ncbi:MAG: metallopeptidase family protein [Clostridia bacterium]|nr:metallopeptidase family protein [Clostridia bacterium]